MVVIAPVMAETVPGSPLKKGGGSRPDASLYLPDSDIGIIIESKLRSPIDENQITRHLEGAGWTSCNDYHRVGWNEVSQAMAVSADNQRSGFLSSQFAEYVELALGSVGMAEFTNFKQTDFDYFIEQPPDYRPVIKNKLEEFARIVHETSLPPVIQEQYSRRYLGQEATDHLWLIVGKADQDEAKDLFKHCNLEVSIDSESINFNAVIRDRKIDAKGYPPAELYARLMGNDVALQEAFNGLPEGFTLGICSRASKNGGRPSSWSDVWTPKFSIDLSLGWTAVRNATIATLDSIDYPGINVTTSIGRGEVIGMEKDQLVKRASASMVELFSVLSTLDPGLNPA